MFPGGDVPGNVGVVNATRCGPWMSLICRRLTITGLGARASDFSPPAHSSRASQRLLSSRRAHPPPSLLLPHPNTHPRAASGRLDTARKPGRVSVILVHDQRFSACLAAPPLLHQDTPFFPLSTLSVAPLSHVPLHAVLDRSLGRHGRATAADHRHHLQHEETTAEE